MSARNVQIGKIGLAASVLLLALVMLLSPGAAVDQTNADCMACHGDKSLTRSDGKPLYVDERALKKTSHGQLSCTDCHTGLDISKTPHADKIQPVTCVDCHSDARSKHTTHKNQVPEEGTPLEISITCKDCHGSHMNKALPGACGICHPEALEDYEGSIHGRAVARGSKDAPVCVDCHKGYRSTSPSSPNSPVHPVRIADTCSECHASEKLNKEYNLPTRRLETYRESYHGIANRFGDTTVANCASCHGSHDIRRSSDPKSSIHKKNLPATCGKCHPGANENYTKGKIHVEVTRKEPLLYYVSSGFKWLTIGTMTALIGHIGLDLLAKFRRRRSRK